MKFLTVEQMRSADGAAVSEGAIPEQILMNRAGAELARAVMEAARQRCVKRMVLVAGHGNNGGDIFVAARCLHQAGFRAHVIMTCPPSALTGAAHSAWDAMRQRDVPFEIIATPESWQTHPDLKTGVLLNGGIVVDGVLGTGCKGEPRAVAAAAINWINSCRADALVIAADLPSGMNGDTGTAAGAVVRADMTVTFAAPKQGFCNPAAMEILGHLTVAEIGIPDEILFRSDAGVKLQLMARPELARAWRGRAWAAHKGSFGHLCVMGGSELYPNAPVLSAMGALRSGAGLVSLWSGNIALAALALIPEVIVRKIVPDEFRRTDPVQRLTEYTLDRFNAVVIGPGLGTDGGAQALVRHVLENFRGRIVLDADGLNTLAELRSDGYRIRDEIALVITPHPGEAARLLDWTVAEVQRDRSAAVKSLAARYNAIAVLKGAGTLVCDAQPVPWLNLTGNPGMASAGMGDVLAGMIGALLAQGLDPMLAVKLAVWAHGTAGDLAAMAGSQTSLTATDLLRGLPDVYQSLER